MAYNVFTPMYTQRTEDKRTREIISNTDWNELWNLNSKQGDHSEEYLYDLKNYFFGTDGISGKIYALDESIATLEEDVNTLFDTTEDLQKQVNGKQKTLKPGTNIIISDDGTISATGKVSVSYELVTGKPSINGVEVNGDLSLEDYNIQAVIEDIDTIRKNASSAKDKEHSHSNKKILDNTTDSFTTELHSAITALNRKTLKDISIATTEFLSDTTYEDYPYRALIHAPGITENDVAEVIFNVTDALSGLYAPCCVSYQDYIGIFASDIPEANITIPSVLWWKGSAE